MINVHNDEHRVSDILLMPKRSKDRILQLGLLANEGNFKHNASVLKKREGYIVVARRDLGGIGKKTPDDYLPCEYCKKFIVAKSIWWHRKKCSLYKMYHEKTCAEGSNNDTHNEPEIRNALRHSRHLLHSALIDEDEDLVIQMLDRMKNDEVKRVVEGDALIRQISALRVDSLGTKSQRKVGDIYRVSQGARTLARLVMAVKKTNQTLKTSLDNLIKPEHFDLVVQSTKTLSREKQIPSLTLGKNIGHLLGHAIQIKIGHAFRQNDDKRSEEASKFQKLFEAEWTYRINAPGLKEMNSIKRQTVQTIPLTEDLQKLRDFIQTNMEKASNDLKRNMSPATWTYLAKLTLCRLILFNKRRRAEVKDLKVQDYIMRPKWNNEQNGELEMVLSSVDRAVSKR